MKIFISMFALSSFVSIATFAQSLPDRIECNLVSSNYKLVLLLKSPQIPAGYTAFGLKNGTSVVFKTASQSFHDGTNILKFVESPATANSKEVVLDLQTKIAKLNHFHRTDLPEGSEFNCQY
jgi:hypothetical protein